MGRNEVKLHPDVYLCFSDETPSTFSGEFPEGRVVTPKLSELKRRHHLDRTTPTQGGAVLSSPPHTKKKPSGKRMVAKSADSISLGRNRL